MIAGGNGTEQVPPNHSYGVALARRWAGLLLAVCACFGLLLGCSMEPPTREVYINRATVQALTPTATPTLPPPTLTPTLAPTSTLAPSATATPPPTTTPIPTTSPTPTMPPTPSPDPRLAGMGYCRTAFGPPDGGPFSGRLVGVETARLDAFDRITFTFADTQGTPRGLAQCIDSAQWPGLAVGSQAEVPGDTVLALGLETWLHDDAWSRSPITETISLTGTSVFGRVSYASDPLSSRGTTIGVGLRVPLPFRVGVEEQPVRLVVEVDRESRLDPRADPLGQPAGRIETPDEPLYFLQNYDVWRYASGRSQPVTTTDELEISLAVSPDGDTLAVCRAPAASDPADLPYDVRSSLWVMRSAGGEERMLADVGGCADLRFAPSGKTISFTANTAAAPPALLSVWTVPVVVGEPVAATPIGDEWSRFGARWLPDSRLIYHARNQSDLSILFVRENDGTEREVSANLLTGPNYRGIGQFIVGADLLAVEALRTNEVGADLVLLRFDGSQVAVERRHYWQRPLTFLPDGSLVYLSTECPSAVAQEYTLLRRSADGNVAEILKGRTAGGIGDVLALDDLLVFNRIALPAPGIRGPQALPATSSQVSLWALTPNGNARRELVRAPVPIVNVRTPAP